MQFSQLNTKGYKVHTKNTFFYRLPSSLILTFIPIDKSITNSPYRLPLILSSW